MELQALIRSHTALDLYALNGDTPETHLTGNTPDISSLVEHAWYDWVWFLCPADEDMEVRTIGRWLGPSHDVGMAMCSKILTQKATIVCRTSVFPLSIEDENSEVVTAQKIEFETALKAKLKDRADGVEYDADVDEVDDETPEYEPYEPNDHAEDKEKYIVPAMPEADLYDHDAFDKYVAAQVVFHKGDSLLYGKVARRKRDGDGNLIGRSDRNPILDTSRQVPSPIK